MSFNVNKFNTSLASSFAKSNVNDLTLDEIDQLQRHLQDLREVRSSERPMYHNPSCTNSKFINSLPSHPEDRILSVSSTTTRMGKRSDKPYFNPYEYGSRQNLLQSTFNQRVMENNYEYKTNLNPIPSQSVMNDLGLNNQIMSERFPGNIRNVDVESALIHSPSFHFPGQRQSSSIAIDRFDLLPFDPQDINHLIWKDNMPRGGVPTRNDRNETY